MAGFADRLDYLRQLTSTGPAMPTPLPTASVEIVPVTAADLESAAVRYTKASFARMNEKQLEKLYREAKDAYYNDARPIMTDVLFDALEDELRAENPQNAALKVVGPSQAPKGVEKVKLPAYMGSLAKIKADGTAANFLLKSRGPYTISDKLDGNSVLVANLDGTTKLYSRGKGTHGFDISVLLPHVKGIGKLNRGEIVRGELIMLNSSFKAHADEYENPRNLVGGIVNRAGKGRAVHKAAASAVFHAHGMIKPQLDLAQAASKLRAKGFTVATHAIVKTLDNEEQLTTLLRKRRGNAKYDMDGLVITDSRGTSIAFKGLDEEAVATVDRVVWTPSRYGMLNPTVMFQESVRLAGVNVSKATAHNAKMVLDNGIGPGAKVRIVRAGDVIPKIVGIVTSTKPQFPPKDQWEWNATKVDILAKRGASKMVDGYVKIQRLSSFVAAMGVEGVRAGLATKLVEAGIDNPLRLVAADEKQLQAAGLGPTQARKLYNDLDRALDRVTHLEMMYGSGLFARGWGLERFYLVLSQNSYADLLALAKKPTQTFIESMKHTRGLEARLLTQLQDGLRRYDQWIKRMNWLPHLDVELDEVIEGPLTGSNVVFTKVRNPDLENRIVTLGGKISGSINTETRWLVAPDGATSAKVRAAEAKGVPIITLDQLVEELTKL